MKHIFTTMFGRDEARINNTVGSAATALCAAGAMRHSLARLTAGMAE